VSIEIDTISGADPGIWIKGRKGIGCETGCGVWGCIPEIFEIDCGSDAILAYFDDTVSYFSVTNSWHTNSAKDIIRLG